MVAYLVGYAMLGLGDDAWRWMLATPAIPGILTLLLRLGTPESPRWLLSKGRVEEAHEVVREVYGEDARLEDLPEEDTVDTDFRKVWRQPYLNRMVPHRSPTLPSSVDWLDDIHSHIVGAREAFGDERSASATPRVRHLR